MVLANRAFVGLASLEIANATEADGLALLSKPRIRQVPCRVPCQGRPSPLQGVPCPMPKLTDCDGQRLVEIPKDFADSRRNWRARQDSCPLASSESERRRA